MRDLNQEDRFERSGFKIARETEFRYRCMSLYLENRDRVAYLAGSRSAETR